MEECYFQCNFKCTNGTKSRNASHLKLASAKSLKDKSMMSIKEHVNLSKCLGKKTSRQTVMRFDGI